MNDNCITKVVGFRRITMGSLVRRYIVTKGQVKPLLDACIIFPTHYDAGFNKGRTYDEKVKKAIFIDEYGRGFRVRWRMVAP